MLKIVKPISPTKNHPYDLNKAKKYPITRLLTVPPIKEASKIVLTNCPFHEDDRASLAIYTSTNSFYCFGCQAKGDSISFYMKLHDVSFHEAVKELGK